MRAGIGLGPVDLAANVDLNREELIVIGGIAVLALLLSVRRGSADGDGDEANVLSLGENQPSYSSYRPGSAGMLSAMRAEAATGTNGGTEVGVAGLVAGEGILGSILVWLYILPYIIVTTIVGIIVAVIGILLQIIGLIGNIIEMVLSMRPVIGLICALRSIFDRRTADRLCGCIACSDSDNEVNV
jgi:hypothetical protein